MTSPTRRAAYVTAAALTAAKLGVHLLTLLPYGIFRDELYYIACSRRLDWGYVDHPPFSIAVLRVWRAVFGDSLAALRVVPAVAGAATVLVGCLLAVELDGGAIAAGLTGLALLTAPQLLGSNHFLSMNSFDLLFWAVAALLVVRILADDRPRRWIALGVVLGLGLENKISVLWLGAGLALALVVTPARRVFRTRGPWLCAAIALLLFAPHVVWQVRHGFPTLEFMHNAMANKYVRESPFAFLGETALMMGLGNLPLWLGGLAFCLLPAGRGTPRVLGVTFLAVLALLVAARTKTEYLAPAFAMVLAAGGVAVERLARRAVAGRVAAGVLAVAMVVLGIVGAPFALPILSEEAFIAYQASLGMRPRSTEKKDLADLPQHFADMHGWPELAAEVERAYATLTPDEKPGAVIWVWGSYGVAAAIEHFGRGLPHVACGHNNYWLWGPGDGDGRAAVVVGGRRERVARYFDDLVQVGTFECAYCMPYENHKPIYVGRRLHPPLAEQWDDNKGFE